MSQTRKQGRGLDMANAYAGSGYELPGGLGDFEFDVNSYTILWD